MGEVSRAVFAYYRWRGWLDSRAGIPEQILEALNLAERFKTDPRSFKEQELVAHAVPDWVNQEVKVTPELARALQAEPKLWLRARAGRGEALSKRLGDCRPFGDGQLEDVLEYIGGEDLVRTAEFHEGQFEIQDLSSQAVGFACEPQPGQTWWDACAGEGGKLLHLSDLMQNKGLIWGSDRAEWRLKKLKRRAARAKAFNYRLAIWDGGSRLPTRTKFDGVLVDAPCSGLGTWHRNPHARWTTTLADVRELAEVQRVLLTNVSAALKPGGRLIYSVCTMTRSETHGVVESFEQGAVKAERLELKNPFNPRVPPARELWFWPQDFGGNGMFIAAWTIRQ